jgi:DNA topoisomerase IB
VPVDDLTLRVAARYKHKKELATGTVVYEYSDQQVARRNNEKANRVEKLRHSLGSLRKKVKSDLKNSDVKTKLTALAVALIDHTYERVGNDDSAEEGHVGVTGWGKQHISFGKGKATIKYVGKSGVKHEKKVDDAAILSALKEAYDAVKEEDGGIFSQGKATITSKEVNDYLKEFDITAKDLRGLHANREMKERLTVIRSKGGALPEEKSKREAILKKEFKEALDGAAEAVGHEASTLRSQYLVPAMEEAYLKDGTVIQKYNEKAAGLDHDEPPPLIFANRIIRQLTDHMVGEDVELEDEDFEVIRVVYRWCKGSWEKFINGDLTHNELLKQIVTVWANTPNQKSKPETI